MSVATWADMAYAVQQAMALASGLPPEQVIWKHQNYDAPALDYVALAFTSSKRIGQDYLEQSYDAARARGQEIAIVVRGVREIMLEAEFFAASTLPGSAPANPPTVPGLDGLARADRSSASMILPEVRDLMRAGGVVPFDPQPVQNVPGVVGTGFRGRAVLPIRCYASAQAVAEYFSWIATVNVTVTAKGGVGGDKVFTVKAPP